MSEKIGQSAPSDTKRMTKMERLADKRAAALKANLRRRKDQNAGRETTDRDNQNTIITGETD